MSVRLEAAPPQSRVNWRETESDLSVDEGPCPSKGQAHGGGPWREPPAPLRGSMGVGEGGQRNGTRRFHNVFERKNHGIIARDPHLDFITSCLSGKICRWIFDRSQAHGDLGPPVASFGGKNRPWERDPSDVDEINAVNTSSSGQPAI